MNLTTEITVITITLWLFLVRTTLLQNSCILDFRGIRLLSIEVFTCKKGQLR